MKYNPIKVVHVYYQPEQEKILVGRLALKDRKVLFEYDEKFLDRKVNISPFELHLKRGIQQSDPLIFDGLFGVFNDSLPDGWGKLLLDRTLIKSKINPGELSVLDRLCFVGSNGMGALVYEPESNTNNDFINKSLDQIADEICEFQEHNQEDYVEDLLELGGSSAGARPKVLISIDDENWIIKFPSSSDPKDIGAIEYAYHLMAKDAGLYLPTAKLFPSRRGPGFFGCIRFDRNKKSKIHMHTISGLLHADHRYPSLDYESIMKATALLTKDIAESLRQYRACIFNILSHNRDDHAKNFAFLMSTKGNWHVSPSYDLTFSSGPGGEHCTMILGEGKNPGTKHLLQLSEKINIQKSDAKNIIEQVRSSISKWRTFADEAGVSNSSCNNIEYHLKKILSNKN